MSDTKEGLFLPGRLGRLKDLAYNLWWSWHPEARALFKEVEPSLWVEAHHNPVLLLKRASARLEALANDQAFLERYDAVIRNFDGYLSAKDTWFRKAHPDWDEGAIAYFSAEFGVHNSLRIYSGGLGILAGDHMKAASDLGVPLVGVGFMYPQGYVQQRIGFDGWQQNVFEQIDWSAAPVRPLLGPSGERLTLCLTLGGWPLKVWIWEVLIGRARLLLMDTNVDGNSPQDREISGRLYGGDRTMRLRQEIVLGVGGVKLLRELGVPARVFHANEGHASFLLIERLREEIKAGRAMAEARAEVAKGAIFTTHTPVAAGHDVFDEGLVADYFKEYWPSLGLDREQFLDLGRMTGEKGWNMAALGLKLSGLRNGVSRRHGHVAREMWAGLWPSEVTSEARIGHVTNGVHLATWVSQEMGWMFAKYLGKDWLDRQDDPKMWARLDDVPDEELWRVHQEQKESFFNLMRRRARARWHTGHADPVQALAHGVLFDRGVLTIGFARRFAQYKRAALIMRDIERLKRLLLNPSRPVQLVFAGKAHPDDHGGKLLIQQVYHLAKDPALAGRLAFVEDYDMHVARYFVHGSDVWLNTPQPPLEACGTSGQKAAANGVPNLSVLDGWWEEGFNGANGWAVGKALDPRAAVAPDLDGEHGESLFEMLEKTIIPLYYDRDEGGVPRGWVKVMKEAIKSAGPRFCAQRMVKQYVDEYYAKAGSRETHASGKKS